MDGHRVARTLADLVARGDRFYLTLAGHRYLVYPATLSIPGEFFDALPEPLRRTDLPDAERRTRRSPDDTFTLVGYLHDETALGGSRNHTILFSETSVAAIDF